MGLIDGEAAVSGTIFSYQQMNRLLQNFRLTAAPGSPVSGMLFSDSDDEMLYHRWAASWGEVVQGDIPLSDNLDIILGTDSDGAIGYDESGDDTLRMSFPSGGLSFRNAIADLDNAGLLKIEKVTKAHDSDLFDAGALTDSAVIWTQPKNTTLLEAKYILDIQFAGGTITDLDVTLGDGGNNSGILNPAAHNLTSDAIGTEYTTRGAYWSAVTTAGYYAAAAAAWTAYATAVGDNLDQTSAGQITFYFLYLDFQGT